MSNPSPTPFRRLWYRWKSLSLPWRRQRLCGHDLSGTTFWEFRDALTAGRMRRIAKYPRKTHYSEVGISPSWLQWLRHTRDAPPSYQEQLADVARQDQMRELAREADRRWESVERFADKPAGMAVGEGDANDVEGETMLRNEEGRQGSATEGARRENGQVEDVATQPQLETEAKEVEGRTTKRKPKPGTEKKDNPWLRQNRSNPGDEWQPEAWQPPQRR